MPSNQQQIHPNLSQKSHIEVIEKVDFKKNMPSKEEIRRKNYIGESVIVEREDEDENE